jgi:hypothetical protein
MGNSHIRTKGKASRVIEICYDLLYSLQKVHRYHWRPSIFASQAVFLHLSTHYGNFLTGSMFINIVLSRSLITKDEGALFYPAFVLQTAVQRTRVIRSSMFLNEKFFATREFEKIKAGLVAGGEQQNYNLCDDLSAPTVSTGSVFTLLSLATHERRKAVVDIGGVFLNAEVKTGVEVHVRLRDHERADGEAGRRA